MTNEWVGVGEIQSACCGILFVGDPLLSRENITVFLTPRRTWNWNNYGAVALNAGGSERHADANTLANNNSRVLPARAPRQKHRKNENLSNIITSDDMLGNVCN